MPFLIIVVILLVLIVWFVMQAGRMQALGAGSRRTPPEPSPRHQAEQRAAPHSVAGSKRTEVRRPDQAASVRQIDAEIAALARTIDAAYRELGEHTASLRRGRGYIARRNNDLDDWHGKSRNAWFGNGGRELPRDSLFGQSLRQRDNFRHDRSVIQGAIQATHREMDRLRKQVIEPAKARREELRRMKKRMGV